MQNAEKISFTITTDTLRAVRDSVEAGECASTSEALRDAVRVWLRQRVEDAERLNAIRARVRRSLDDPRPDLSFEEVDSRLAKLHTDTVTARGDAATEVRFRHEALDDLEDIYRLVYRASLSPAVAEGFERGTMYNLV